MTSSPFAPVVFPALLFIVIGAVILASRKRLGRHLAWARMRTMHPRLRDTYAGVRGEERLLAECVGKVTLAGVCVIVFGVTVLFSWMR